MTESIYIKGKEYSSPPYSIRTMELLKEFVDAIKLNGSLSGRIDIPLEYEDGTNELLVLDGLETDEVSVVTSIWPQGLSLQNKI